MSAIAALMWLCCLASVVATTQSPVMALFAVAFALMAHELTVGESC